MKPKTKHNHLVVKLHEELPDIKEKTINWGYQKMFPHYVHLIKKYATCMDCGHRWAHNNEFNLKKRYITTCPNCNEKLEKWPSQTRTEKFQRHIQILDTFKGQQLVRLICMTKVVKVLFPADLSYFETTQHWTSPEGSYSVIAQAVYYHSWSVYTWPTGMCLREPKDKYHNNYPIAPGRKIIPNLKRNGYKPDFSGFTPSVFIKEILGNSRFETLFKLHQWNLIDYILRNPREGKRRWRQIKIALRHNCRYFDHSYSTSTWFDHLSYLKYFNKDLNNPKFICPKDLDGEHKILYAKRRKIEEKLMKQWEYEAELQRQIQLKIDDQKYQKEKGRYLDFRIETEMFYIEPLKSISEFAEEAEDMHHCIYTHEYYKNKEDLILSAKLHNGERLETIEYSIKENKVLQSRSRYNEISKYHNQIVELMNNSTNQIKQLEHVRRSKTTHQRNVKSYTALAEV